jgi:hypothetical protein
MTRGQDGSLCLSCMTLSFTTPRRFYPGALSILLKHAAATGHPIITSFEPGED